MTKLAKIFLFSSQKWSQEELSSLPSFPEFAAWLIQDRAGQDGSRESWEGVLGWAPYYVDCPLCQLNFTTLRLDGER